MQTFNYDSYNQTVTFEICQSLKAVQGGDDVPRVLIIYDEKEERLWTYVKRERSIDGKQSSRELLRSRCVQQYVGDGEER